jgi:hypothetical protein
MDQVRRYVGLISEDMDGHTWWNSTLRDATGGNPFKLQEKLSAPLLELRKKRFVEELCAGPRGIQRDADITRYVSTDCNTSGKFLFAVPCSPVTTMSPKQFQVACQLRLGVAIPHHPSNARCFCKKRPLLDVHGDHALMCPTDNHLKARHDSIVRLFATLASEAGIAHRVEDSKTLTSDEENVIRPNIILLNSTAHGLADVVCDVAVTHPISYQAKELNTILTPGRALQTTRQSKIFKYNEAQDSNVFKFEPLIFESLGRWEEGVEKMLSILCKESAIRNDTLYSVVKFKWTVRLSTAIQKGNATATMMKMDYAKGFTLQGNMSYNNYIEDMVDQYAVPVC